MTLDEYRAALAFVGADEEHDWIRAGMALHHEFGGQTAAFQVWDEWSRNSDKYDPKNIKDRWKSFGGVGSSGKPVTGATLVHMAKKNGFTRAGSPQPLSIEEKKQREKQRAQAQARAEKKQADDWAAGAKQADAKWSAGKPASPSHPYVKKKGITPHGARELGGKLLIPFYFDGQLSTLETIDSDGAKRATPGGRRGGAYMTIGKQDGARAWLVCEGWATGCSLYAATGLPVVVSGPKGNMQAISGKLPVDHPDAAAWIVCGDLDESGGGQDRAEAAAAKIGEKAAVCLPFFDGQAVAAVEDPKARSDFNDMARISGAEAVRVRVMAAIDALEATRHRPNYVKQAAVTPAKPAQSIAPGFYLQETASGGKKAGVYARGDEDKPDVWLCTPLRVVATLYEKGNNGDGEHESNYAKLLSFSTLSGCDAQLVIHQKTLGSDPRVLLNLLLDRGLSITGGNARGKLLSSYIEGSGGDYFARTARRTGWYGTQGNAFVLKSETIAPPGEERVLFDTQEKSDDSTAASGNLAEWQRQVAALAVGNSRIIFSISAAFAAPLLGLCELNGFGFNLYGVTSKGKTTCANVAASVWGKPSGYVYKWRSTANAMEARAVVRNDMLMVLDEIGTGDEKEAGALAYALADGTGKGRAGINGDERAANKWTVLMLSTGEKSFADHVAGSGKAAKGGQRVRMIDIQAETGLDGMGVADTLHGRASIEDFCREISLAAERCHGTAARAFLERVVADRAAICGKYETERKAMIAECVPEDAESEVRRAAGHFAVVAMAGELASLYGVTGWPQGAARDAVRRLFAEWLDARGTPGAIDTENGLNAVRELISRHGDSRFHGINDALSSVNDRAGVKEVGPRGYGFDALANETIYFVFPEAMKRVLADYSAKHVLEEMAKRGWLIAGADGKLKIKKKIPGMGPRGVYALNPAAFDNE